MWTAAVLAAIGTGVWAICLSRSESGFEDLRFGLCGAGIISLLSMLVVPPCQPPSTLSIGLSAILFGYQCLIYFAVSKGGAVMQAVVNCNIIVVCLHRHFFVTAAEHPPALFAAVVSAASSAALLTACRF